jgi:hypothetical protein
MSILFGLKNGSHTCDEVVAQENDHLKLEVKRLDQMVSELMKQANV